MPNPKPPGPPVPPSKPIDEQLAKRFSGALGRTIHGIRAMTRKECEDSHLDYMPHKPWILIELSGPGGGLKGPALLITADPECNGPGFMEFLPE